MNEELIAVVTLKDNEAVGGDVPIFYAATKKEQAEIAGNLARVMRAMVHDMGNDVYIVVKH